MRLFVYFLPQYLHHRRLTHSAPSEVFRDLAFDKEEPEEREIQTGDDEVSSQPLPIFASVATSSAMSPQSVYDVLGMLTPLQDPSIWLEPDQALVLDEKQKIKSGSLNKLVERLTYTKSWGKRRMRRCSHWLTYLFFFLC